MLISPKPSAKLNRRARRRTESAYQKALRDHVAELKRVFQERYEQLGNAEWRKRHDFPDVLPDEARRMLAEAWAIGRIGPKQPRRVDYVVR